MKKVVSDKARILLNCDICRPKLSKSIRNNRDKNVAKIDYCENCKELINKL